MTPVLSEFLEFMRPYWSGVALAATWAGIGVVWWSRRRAWQRKQFLSQVNFSLNYIQDSSLAMRTLLELPAAQVWLNEHGSALVVKASRKTAIEQPFIHLSEVKDQDFLHRAVLNALSERYADGFLAAALGLPVARDNFVFGITCEKYGEIRTLKVRILLIREKTLTELFGPPRRTDSLNVPNPVLRARLRTLEIMYQHFQEDQHRTNRVLGRVELGLPIPVPT
jgi:hypothetical protein